jgi:peptidoglycan hydrolase CwlO-like protein
LAAVVFFAPVAVNADQFDDQINQLNAQIAQQQSAANALQSQANTLSNQVAALNDQIDTVAAQIQLNQAKQAQTAAQIAAAQQQLATKKAILDEEVRAIYQDSQVTPLEMLASSQSLSAFVDKQQYNDQIKDHIQDELAQITQLEAGLVTQQNSLNLLVAQQSSLANSLQQQKNQQAQLLAETQGQESNYQALVASNQSKLNSVIAARAAAIRNSSSSGLSLVASGGSCGPYPDKWCSAPQDSLTTDGNYYNRECTSYAAYRRETTGHSLPSGYGNAADWPTDSSTPAVGDVAVWGANANAYIGGDGHVAYVEAVDSTGITISQYNFDIGNGPGLYSEIHINTGSTMWGGIGFLQ